MFKCLISLTKMFYLTHTKKKNPIKIYHKKIIPSSQLLPSHPSVPSAPSLGRFPCKPEGSGGRPGTEGRRCHWDTLDGRWWTTNLPSIQHKRIQTQRHRGRCRGRQPAVSYCTGMHVQLKTKEKWTGVEIWMNWKKENIHRRKTEQRATAASLLSRVVRSKLSTGKESGYSNRYIFSL